MSIWFFQIFKNLKIRVFYIYFNNYWLKQKMNKNKFIIILAWFIDILAFWIFIPTMPDLTKYYWVDAHSISYAIVFYAFFSFLFWPILWQLSDKYWRKIVLLLCIVWSFVSSLVMSLSVSFFVFLLWRIINWASWWNISVIQSMLNDISKTKEERMYNMWILWWLFGLGFIIWPTIWALLLTFWFGVKSIFWLMTWISLVEFFLVQFFLSETNKNITNKKININPFKIIIKYLKNKDSSLFLISFFILIFSFSLYQWMFTVFLNKHFWLPWDKAWYVMAWVWLAIAINQAFLLKRFWLKYFNLKSLFFISNIWIFIIFCLLSFINNLTLFLIVFYIMVPFQWLINPIYQSEIVETSHINDRWEIMWVLWSLQSITMFIWPLISWILIDKDISMFMFWAWIVFINLIIITSLVKKIKN